MGFIGQVVKIFQINLLSCVLVGFLWTALYTKILYTLRNKEIEDEPEQALADEE
jgi:hypothetical protein